MQELVHRVEGLGSPRIVVVGDFFLDRYVHGDVERISPEAPVPVLRVVQADTRVGGSGNVAAAALALGANVACVGLLGKDPAGSELAGLLRAMGAETSALLALPDRPTGIKTRYVGLAQHRSPQQILRVDEEVCDPLSAPVQVSLRSALRGMLESANLVALEDYNKGVLDDDFTPQLIADARARKLPVIVDPARIADYRRYRGATLLTPNRYEAALASGLAIHDDASLVEAAKRIVAAAESDAVVITLDREGMFLYTRDGQHALVPHQRPRQVYDITGAGDEVLAVLAVTLAQGWDCESACRLANVAGGLEVERFGIVPIRRDEIIDELRRMIGLRGSKILPRDRLADELHRRRRRGEAVVFTNGCFDLLHMGHMRYLQQARELGACLVVGINSDASVQRLKGPSRPVIPEHERAEILGALECVDYVTIFDEDTPEPLLRLLTPDILVKGGTTGKIVGEEIVEGYGGTVAKLAAVDGLSTTNIIERILTTYGR